MEITRRAFLQAAAGSPVSLIEGDKEQELVDIFRLDRRHGDWLRVELRELRRGNAIVMVSEVDKRLCVRYCQCSSDWQPDHDKHGSVQVSVDYDLLGFARHTADAKTFVADISTKGGWKEYVVGMGDEETKLP